MAAADARLRHEWDMTAWIVCHVAQPWSKEKVTPKDVNPYRRGNHTIVKGSVKNLGHVFCGA